MIPSYLAGEIMKQRVAEARERGERSRLVAAAKQADRERRNAVKKPSARPAEPAPDVTETAAEPAGNGNAEQGTAMSC
jgi:hypothetical protein